MKRIDALDQFQKALAEIKDYVVEHGTVEDLSELNAKYVPEQLQSQVDWLIDMGARLLDADPAEPDHDTAVDVPPVPTR